ncbi:hypothetical protein BRADI_2g35125v3 [Brachypodium distachyon]|uniref:Uncharacterized protein n=1 Tax=Brachypodium distachyon TaxID=15368 RepID=A0A0Q3MSV6_BRADI|nr:hypothetical protein BRADI_2g35125v3 [Brachypodium distachyon]
MLMSTDLEAVRLNVCSWSWLTPDGDVLPFGGFFAVIVSAWNWGGFILPVDLKNYPTSTVWISASCKVDLSNWNFSHAAWDRIAHNLWNDLLPRSRSLI